MKDRNVSKKEALVFLLAVSSLLGGVLASIWVFRYLEKFILLYGHHEHLSAAFRDTAYASMIAGSLVVFGVGSLMILTVYMLRRSTRVQREAEVLRKKNRAMEELNRQTQKLAHHQRLEIKVKQQLT